MLDLRRRGRISARKYLGARKSLPVARTNLVRGSLRHEQISARNYLGKSSFYGWFILWLWPPMKEVWVVMRPGGLVSQRQELGWDLLGWCVATPGAGTF